MKYDEHPAASIFPMLPESDLVDLAVDIEKRGLNHPIIIHEGLVLDGRNRLAACEMIDVEPSFQEWDGRGGTPTQFVISENLHRRHLTTSQRAAIAAEVLPQLEEEAKERKVATQIKDGLPPEPRSAPDGAHRNGDPDKPIMADKGRSAEKAAKLFNVGRRSVERAKAVREVDPDEFEKIKRGETTATTAYRERVKGKRKQKESEPDTYEITTTRHQQLADAQKRRMVNGLSHIDGICRGFQDLDVAKVVAACDDEEIETWASKANDLSNELRKLRKRLHEAQDGRRQNDRQADQGEGSSDSPARAA